MINPEDFFKKWFKKAFALGRKRTMQSCAIKLEQTDFPGTGNSRVQVEKKEILRLNNTLISPEQGKKFVEFVLKDLNRGLQVEVNFSRRTTSRCWGSVTRKGKRINIYRWSAWVLIHEIGHVLTRVEKKQNGRRIIHGPEFGWATTQVYRLWLQFSRDDRYY
ncbi:hypothetical protein [Desulfonatronovibrio hydrogenovorans]|uniref:hypothetical protein n=1 Tax=Desulfonatronovibrio hydrogenovorans TaxID=53245 RepID=UPI0012375287|nr:hypothetical protein [Desulfonatronovibrio hydrogenovorans]